MSQLKDIVIKAQEYTENFLNFPFYYSTYHVAKVFLHFLPQKFVLDNAGYFQINCDMRLEQDVRDYRYSKFDNASEVVWGRFDFPLYKSSSAEQRQFQILALIMDVLIYVAQGNQGLIESITEAEQKTIDAGFACKQPIKKLNCSNKEDGSRFAFYKACSLNYGEAWSVEMTQEKKRPVDELWLTRRPNYLDFSGHYRKSKLENGRLYILDSLGDRQLVIDYVNKTVTNTWAAPQQIPQDSYSQRYDKMPIDIKARAQAAISRAGHAVKRGDAAEVVALLEPYKNYLNNKQMAMLENATVTLQAKK